MAVVFCWYCCLFVCFLFSLPTSKLLYAFLLYVIGLAKEISPRCSSERLGGVASLGTSACSRPNIKTMQATAREETQG